MNLPFVAENLPFASAASVKFHLLSSHFDQIFLIVKLYFTLLLSILKGACVCVWGGGEGDMQQG